MVPMAEFRSCVLVLSGRLPITEAEQVLLLEITWNQILTMNGKRVPLEIQTLNSNYELRNKDVGKINELEVLT